MRYNRTIYYFPTVEYDNYSGERKYGELKRLTQINVTSKYYSYNRAVTNVGFNQYDDIILRSLNQFPKNFENSVVILDGYEYVFTHKGYNKEQIGTHRHRAYTVHFRKRGTITKRVQNIINEAMEEKNYRWFITDVDATNSDKKIKPEATEVL